MRTIITIILTLCFAVSEAQTFRGGEIFRINDSDVYWAAVKTSYFREFVARQEEDCWCWAACVQTQQMQQSYYDVWSNYWNYFASTPSFSSNHDWNWNTYYYPANNYNTYRNPTSAFPTYNYQTYFNNAPGYSTPSSNYHASNDVKIPANTKIIQIDSDTQLGRQLLGKIGR